MWDGNKRTKSTQAASTNQYEFPPVIPWRAEDCHYASILKLSQFHYYKNKERVTNIFADCTSRVPLSFGGLKLIILT